MVEVTASIVTFLLILFGIIEFSFLYYQWNAATKALQWGARLAAVSDPISSNMTEAGMSGLSASVLPGDPMPSFNCTCSGASASCTGSVPSGASACAYSAAAMRSIVYGRGKNACVNRETNPLLIGMCNYFDRITPQNVVVSYRYTGLGYAGRPGGPVPTITVSVTGLTFNFVALNSLIGRASIAMPNFATTVTGEDLRISGS